jgi:endonuclease/exonuclease/phosphatase (EEP) superfamily protein YafD
MTRRILAAIVLVVVSAILLVFVWPQLFHLQDAPIIAQVVSLRGLDVGIAVGLIVLLLILSVWRRARRLALSLTIPLVVFSLISVAILGSRGFGGPTTTVAKTGDLTVLEWNTRGDSADAQEIETLALREDANVIALPGTTQATGIDVALAMKAAGHPMWVLSNYFDKISKSRSTTLLVSSSLGGYTVDNAIKNTTVQPSLVARPDDGTGPTFVVVHAVSPRPFEMRNWHADINYLSTLCAGSNVIMAGDLNSTLDTLQGLSTKAGSDFGQCTDAARVNGTAAVGSWPTSLPPLLGAQIDHVMTTTGWRAISLKVITTEDNSGSDHRPIVAVLAPTP